MPLTTDEKLSALRREVIETFDKANGGVHPGFRPAHAKGILLTGTFTPFWEAASLTRAPHLQRNSTPVTVRFSDQRRWHQPLWALSDAAASRQRISRRGRSTAARRPNFLFDEIKERVAKEPVRFRVAVQLADDAEIVDDATVRWPEDRPQLAFGELSLREIAPNNAGEQQQIIFDPIPRVDGIEASADPLFEPRANIYLMSGRRRRAAGQH